MTKNEIMNEINICRNILQQHDYTARKVAFEVAKKFKEANPSVEMPVLDKYLANEEKAELLRNKIDELEAQLANDENKGAVDE